MVNLESFPEFLNLGWKLTTISNISRASYGTGTTDDDIVATKALSKFIRENRRFKLSMPPGAFAFGFDLYRNDKDDTQTSPIRFGFGKMTEDRLVTLSSNIDETLKKIRFNVPDFELEIAVQLWPGFSLRFNGDTVQGTRSPIEVGKHLYFEFPERYHDTLVNDTSLNVNFFFLGEVSNTEFANWFSPLTIPNPGSRATQLVLWKSLKLSVSLLRTPGPSYPPADDDVMAIQNDIDPETGEILNKHVLLGSGMLAKKYITIEDPVLIYTVPKKKSGTVNIDMTNMGTTMLQLTIYIGTGSDHTSADIVRSDIYVPRDGFDVNINKMKLRYGGMESILCNPGDKIWVKIVGVESIPVISSSTEVRSTVKLGSDSAISNTITSSNSLASTSNPPSAISGFEVA